jgi:DNA-binding LytR/AlgR family response regulator
MKIHVEKHPEINETEIIIKCKDEDEEVKAIKNALTYFDMVLICRKDDQQFKVPSKDVFYIDAYGHEVFVYTKEQTYSIDLKLYQLEEMLSQTPFIRIHKSVIVNTKKIKSFKSHINGRMEAILLNDIHLIVSRMYVKSLKEKLGGKSS